MADDDGREFLLVELTRYRESAVSPRLDLRRRPPLRPRRGPLAFAARLHPAFGRSAGRFLTREGADEWDVGLGRYRSRRDLLGLCVDLSTSRTDVHKWAAIEKTHVFPIQLRFGPMPVRLIVLGLLASITALLGYVL